MAPSKSATLAYRIAAALTVLAGFLIFWFTAAVQIIGDENPGNILYGGIMPRKMKNIVEEARQLPCGGAHAGLTDQLISNRPGDRKGCG